MSDPIICNAPSIDPSLATLSLNFPGGVTIVPPVTSDIQDALAVSRAMLGQLSTALAPLAPIFNLIKFAQDVLGLATALKDALGPPPDPSKLISAIEKLAVDVDKLVSLAPALSLPVLMKSILHLLISTLVGIRGKMQVLISVANSIASSAARADVLRGLAGGAGQFAAGQLDLSVECAREGLTAQLQGLTQGLGPLGELLGIINGFTQPIGLPPIAAVGSFDLEDPSVNIAPLDDAISVLTAVQAALPV